MSEPLPAAENLESAVEQFLDEMRAGRRPSVEAFAERHPELADELREILPTMAMLEEVKADDEHAAGLNGNSLLDEPRLVRLGDYRVLREIGRGGMGVVYEAEQESLGRKVALKVLVHHALVDARYVKRFHREARTAAQLHHTNIVPVFGVGMDQGMHYFVMQYIPGRGLDQVIRELARLGPVRRADPAASSAAMAHESTVGSGLSVTGRDYWRRVAAIGADVAGALDYAHAHGTLHRDIKPSNLLLDETGSVWVTDFGLARVPDDEDLTRSGDVLGTLRYLAPEALKGRFDARSDLFSLGLALYELCALKPAREASGREQLVRQVALGEIPPLRRANREVPRDLETIIGKAVEADPERRYRSAGELAADLARFRADRPIAARRAMWVEKAWRWCRRNPLVAATSAAAVVAVVATALVAFFAVAKSRDEALSALGEMKSQRAQTLLQKGRTEAARTLAERSAAESRANALLARRAVFEFLVRISDDNRLRATGLESLRRTLAESAGRFYDQLLDANPDDFDFKADRARAYVKLAQLMWELGDARRAIDLRRKTGELYEALAARPAERAAYQQAQAVNLVRRGDIHFKIDEVDEAHACYEAAIARLGSLVDGATGRAIADDALGTVLSSLGKHDLELADLARAEMHYIAALGAMTRSPEGLSAADRLAFADAQFDLGVVYCKLGRFAAAEALTRMALATLVALAKGNEHNPTYPEVIAEAEECLGTILHRGGHPADAEPVLRRAVARFAPLLEQRPEVRRYLGGLARRRLALAEFLRDTHRRDEAIGEFDAALALFAKRVEKFPETTRYRRELADARLARAQLHLTTDGDAAAEPLIAEAIAAYQKLADEHASEPLHRYKLATAWRKASAAYEAGGRSAAALAAAESAEAILSQLHDHAPGERLYGVALAQCLAQRSRLLDSLHRQDESQRDRARAEALVYKFDRATPELPNFVELVAAGREALANVYRTARLGRAAVQEMETALEVRRTLAASDGASGERRRQLALSLHRMALVYKQSRRTSDAARLHEESTGLLARLADEQPNSCMHRLDLAYTYAIWSNDAQAARHAEMVTAAAHAKPVDRFRAAGVYSRAAEVAERRAVNGDEPAAAAAEAYFAAAIDILRRLGQEGYFAAEPGRITQLTSGSDFSALRARIDLEQLVREAAIAPNAKTETISPVTADRK